jgi:alkylhydroperoxidase/carboxymuconolactone decarboxylase family protein YurZ
MDSEFTADADHRAASAGLLLPFERRYERLLQRRVLDDRTRLLIAVGACTVLGERRHLERQLVSALERGATPREALEVILQATIYVGFPRIDSAVEVFVDVVERLGRLCEITETQLPLVGRLPERSLEAERATWRASHADPAWREALLARYGWPGVSSAFRLDAHSLDWLDRVDGHFLKLWLEYIYAEMYTRTLLDEKTRLLVMVGECVVLGEIEQATNHMRRALAAGATPDELLEVLLQSTPYASLPPCHAAARRLGELVDAHPAGADFPSES